jgi:hypothetical protein
MKSSGGNSLKEDNIGRVGRQECNKMKKAIELIGEENIKSLYAMQLDLALHHPDPDVRVKCAQFLLDKVTPRAIATPKLPEGRYVNIPLIPMDTMADIKENGKIIAKYICEGSISLEEGEKLLDLTEQARRLYETNEVAKMVNDIDRRLKEEGR